MANYIQVAGKSNIYVTFPAAPSTVLALGEQLNDTRISIQNYRIPVYGDSHGGPDGPPIEIQDLGKSATTNFQLSKWDPEVYEQIIAHNNMATNGEIDDAEVGSLLLLERSIRLTIQPSKDNAIVALGHDPFFWNFPCCVVEGPVDHGQGTKHSILQFSMMAHRCPPDHAKAGVLWDRDATDVPALS